MNKTWWKEAVVYQIYPRSFADSNGDGIGDIKGIIRKLDYLKQLGIDVVWLSPVYKSPNDDNGYDISDYRDIMDEFGTMADWDELLYEMHKRGIKLIMDLVVNHTSDEHPWFIESRSSASNDKRDYYIWRKGNSGNEPNNWSSCFTPSAWKYDEKTGEYYLHLFSEKQPDLNWENPRVRKEVFDMMTFWLEKGIDGFRMDVINFISKAPGLPTVENGQEGYQWGGEFFMNGPRVHEYLHEMNQKVLSKYDIMTVGETPGVTVDEGILYVGEDRQELNMLFQFELMDVDSGPNGKWDLKDWKLTDIKKIMTRWQKGLSGKGWNSLYMNNHDQPRMVSRFGDDKNYRKESAKMLATFLHTLQGTPYVYQGEEIGMTNVKFKTIDEYKDIETLNIYREMVGKGKVQADDMMRSIYAKGRDNARTPMQWNSQPNAGFTAGTPWISVNPNYTEINVEESMKDDHSIFHYYQRLIKLRKKNEVLVYGEYDLILEDNEQIYAYTRTFEGETVLVVLNFFGKNGAFEMPGSVDFAKGELMISNYPNADIDDIRKINLRPYEARVYRVVG